MKLQSRLLLIIMPCGVGTILFICWVTFTAMLQHEKQDMARVVARDLALMGDPIWQSETVTRNTRDERVATPMITAMLQNTSQTYPATHSTVYVGSSDGTLVSLDNGSLSRLEALVEASEPDALASLPLIDVADWHDRISLHDAGGVVGRYSLPAGLSLISYTSRAHLFDEIRNTFFLIAFVTAFGTFGGIFTFLSLQRRMILIPLLDVSANAKQIGLDAYDNAPCLNAVMPRSDEIGELSRAVDNTHQRLLETIGELQASHVENERLAYQDNLTDLPNRRLFQKQAETHLQEAAQDGRQLAVVFMDLDNFKNINDIHGHDAGDQLLLEVSHRLRESLGYNDESDERVRLAARLGGDEFIFMVDAGHGEDARERAATAARELLDAVVQPMMLNNAEHQVSASLGIALYPEHGETIETLSTCADAAMYEAKRNNKNGFAVYHDSMLESLAERLTLEKDLVAAIGTEQLCLHYQPKYDIESGEMVGAEALLRWTHPQLGNIPPDRFISIAEESGSIHEIGAWVIDDACRQWRSWQDQGTPLPQVAVNVSSRQFERGDLRQSILDALQRHDCPPSALEIELTESCVMASFDEIHDTLRQLREDGISIAIDDFGTGYSSLSLISSMPVQTLKIDRSFVAGMKSSNSNGKIVTTLLHLAEQLSLKVVAEGIEEADELALLRSLSCDFGQGYYLNRPMDVDAMTNELAAHRGLHELAA